MISFVSLRKDKGSFNVCEDSLTSVVFDLLKYLPSEILYRIIKKSLYDNKLPNYPGELVSISFWEKWDASNTSNSSFVEPDVFIRFQNIDLIIEAKRYDEYQQSQRQIENELIAYFNEYIADGKEVYLIQMGGLFNKDDTPDFNYDGISAKICKSDWSQLLNEVHNESLFYKNHHLSLLRSYSRILEDCMRGFEMHQFYKKKWLKDILRVSVNDKALSNSLVYNVNKSRFSLLKNLISPVIDDSLLIDQFSYARR